MVWVGNLWISDSPHPFYGVSVVCCGSRSCLDSQFSVQFGFCSSLFLCGFHCTDVPSPLQHSGVSSSALPAACCGWVHLPGSLQRSPTLASLLLSAAPSVIGGFINIYYYYYNHHYYVWHACGGQRATLWSKCSPSHSVWAHEIGLRLLVLLSVLPAEPSHRLHTDAVYLNFLPHKLLVS